MNNKQVIERRPLNERPTHTFAAVFERLSSLPERTSAVLQTTGTPGVPFTAAAKYNRKDGRPCVVATSGSRNQSKIYIYSEDWGFKLSANGVRIAHYSVPLDEWVANVRK